MKKIISYLLIFSMLFAMMITVVPTIEIKIEAAEPPAEVLYPTEQYKSIRNGGKYIYDVDDLYALNGKMGAGKATYEIFPEDEYIIQNDLTLTADRTIECGHLILNGMNTEGRTVTITLSGTSTHVLQWGHCLTIKNLNLAGSITINSAKYCCLSTFYFISISNFNFSARNKINLFFIKITINTTRAIFVKFTKNTAIS